MEYTKEDLEKLGFVMIPGILEEALRANDVYGFYEILPNEKAFLSMKRFGSSYLPHRAIDTVGKTYTEPELINLFEDSTDNLEFLLSYLSTVSKVA